MVPCDSCLFAIRPTIISSHERDSPCLASFLFIADIPPPSIKSLLVNRARLTSLPSGEDCSLMNICMKYMGLRSHDVHPTSRRKLIHTHTHMSFVTQPALGGSPDALVGRLYAGRGRQQRLAENSPPRNTSFGTTTVHSQRHDAGAAGDNTVSPVSRVSGLIRSRTAAAAATTLARDAFAEQEQHDLLVPKLHNKPLGSSLVANSGDASSSGADPQQHQPREDGINSPPRLGLRRRSSGNSSTTPKRNGNVNSTVRRGSGSASAAAGYQSDSKRGSPSTHQQHQSVGGGMTLSRSLGALGQAGAGRSTLAIVNTRDDGAPYLRSEKMSPKSSVGVASGLSPTRSSPGREPTR